MFEVEVCNRVPRTCQSMLVPWFIRWSRRGFVWSQHFEHWEQECMGTTYHS